MYSEPSLRSAPTPAGWSYLLCCCVFAFFVFHQVGPFCIDWVRGDHSGMATTSVIRNNNHVAMLLPLRYGHSKPSTVAALDVGWVVSTALLLIAGCLLFRFVSDILPCRLVSLNFVSSWVPLPSICVPLPPSFFPFFSFRLFLLSCSYLIVSLQNVWCSGLRIFCRCAHCIL